MVAVALALQQPAEQQAAQGRVVLAGARRLEHHSHQQPQEPEAPGPQEPTELPAAAVHKLQTTLASLVCRPFLQQVAAVAAEQEMQQH